MKVVRDLAGGPKPPPLDLIYNGDLASDSSTKRYRGSLVKLMDFNDIDHGVFATYAGNATALENIIGLLEEDQGTTGNYLLDDGTYGARTRKITPILPSSIVRAEYGAEDAAGTTNLDTSATATAASTDFTVTISTADTMIGGWIYMTNGSEANYLHYVTDNETTKCVFATAVVGAVASGDDFIVIRPPFEKAFLFDGTLTGLKSEVSDGSLSYANVTGLQTWIKDVGIPMQPLDRDKHDGLKLKAPTFYHDFLLNGTTTIPNVWYGGIRRT